MAEATWELSCPAPRKLRHPCHQERPSETQCPECPWGPVGQAPSAWPVLKVQTPGERQVSGPNVPFAQAVPRRVLSAHSNVDMHT